MTIKAGLFSGLVFLLIVQSAAAQTPNPVVGAWERISMTDARGEVAKQEPAFLLFSASGHFAQTVTPAGRPKINKPLQDMTKEELLARFQGLSARFGTYTIAGDKLTRKNVAHISPAAEGTSETQLFRIDRDVLILTTEGEKGEVRFKRLEQVP
jgi:hypothetical protein